MSVVNARRALLDAGVELVELGPFLVQGLFIEDVKHLLHGEGNGVVLGEVVAFEEGVEHRTGDEVLGENLDGFGLADVGIDVLVETIHKARERGAMVRTGMGEDPLNACDMGLGDLGNVLRPGFPVPAIAAFLDDLGVDCVAPFVEVGERESTLNQVGSVTSVAVPVWTATDTDHLQLIVLLLVELDLIDEGIEAVVMGTEGLEHLPDHLVLGVVVERFLRGSVGRHTNRQDDVAVFLARRFPHHPTDGLHHVHH